MLEMQLHKLRDANPCPARDVGALLSGVKAGKGARVPSSSSSSPTASSAPSLAGSVDGASEPPVSQRRSSGLLVGHMGCVGSARARDGLATWLFLLKRARCSGRPFCLPPLPIAPVCVDALTGPGASGMQMASKTSSALLQHAASHGDPNSSTARRKDKKQKPSVAAPDTFMDRMESAWSAAGAGPVGADRPGVPRKRVSCWLTRPWGCGDGNVPLVWACCSRRLWKPRR